MSIERSELEWSYTPADFFEASYRRKSSDYSLVADAWKVVVTLQTSVDPVDAALRARVAADVEGLFKLRQLQIHRSCELSDPTICQHHNRAGKSVSITASVGLTLALVGQLDFVVRDASGVIEHDSKAERIAEHTKFLDSVMVKVATCARLRTLLDSYGAAVRGKLFGGTIVPGSTTSPACAPEIQNFRHRNHLVLQTARRLGR